MNKGPFCHFEVGTYAKAYNLFPKIRPTTTAYEINKKNIKLTIKDLSRACTQSSF